MKFFSLFSALILDVPDKDKDFFDSSYIPIKEEPKNCNKCYKRFHKGRDTKNYIYYPCNCIIKNKI